MAIFLQNMHILLNLPVNQCPWHLPFLQHFLLGEARTIIAKIPHPDSSSVVSEKKYSAISFHISYSYILRQNWQILIERVCCLHIIHTIATAIDCSEWLIRAHRVDRTSPAVIVHGASSCCCSSQHVSVRLRSRRKSPIFHMHWQHSSSARLRGVAVLSPVFIWGHINSPRTRGLNTGRGHRTALRGTGVPWRLMWHS